MNKKLRIGILCSIIVLVMTLGHITVSEGVNTNDRYIKVGLQSPLYSDKWVNLYSSNGFSLMTVDEGFEKVFDIISTVIFVRLDYGFNDLDIETGPYHIELDMVYNSYEEVKEQVEHLRNNDIAAYPYFNNKVFKIWIGQFISEQCALDYITEIENTIKNEMKVVHPDNRRIFINNFGGQELLVFDKDTKLFISSVNANELTSIVQVEKNKYRGYITFNRVDDELITINYVNLEQYLCGVVPREMSGSWPIEALKAQAVSARNYALQRLGTHGNKGYDVCDTTHCQVYGGYNSEKINSTRAVTETTDKLLTYNGKIVSTFYHSSSGGKTEDSENVWGSVVPYLRGVDDKFSLGAPNENWKLIISKSQIKETLENNDIYIGEIINIQPVKYSKSGRVIELGIIGTEGIHFLKNEQSRAIFGYNSLKSTMYEVESQGGAYVLGANYTSPKRISLDETTIISGSGVRTPTRGSDRDDDRQVRVFNGNKLKTISSLSINYVFEGSGWGHGLGMSQWGAKKMAEEGYTFEEILKHYYTGTEIE